MKLLVAEDDTDTRLYLERGLREAGHAVTLAVDGRDALFLATGEPFDVIVLDRMLPIVDGLSVLKSLRSAGLATPILMLTALSRVEDRVDGLEAGADDYLVKPFAVEELVARLKAVLRRQGAFQGSVLRFANLRFDTDARDVSADDRAVVLSAREMELLALLMRRGGQVVAKRLVEDQLYGLTGSLGSNAVEVYIHRLRRRIEEAGATARIETIRGVGYMLRATS